MRCGKLSPEHVRLALSTSLETRLAFQSILQTTIPHNELDHGHLLRGGVSVRLAGKEPDNARFRHNSRNSFDLDQVRTFGTIADIRDLSVEPDKRILSASFRVALVLRRSLSTNRPLCAELISRTSNTLARTGREFATFRRRSRRESILTQPVCGPISLVRGVCGKD